MTEPKQPDDHPAIHEMPQHVPDRDPTGINPNGVPPDADAEATGLPTSDRQQTETTAHPDKHQP